MCSLALGCLNVSLDRTNLKPPLEWLSDCGKIGAWIRDHDWSDSPLGSIECWPEELHSSLRLCLNAQFPLSIFWGQDSLFFYNEQSLPMLGNKHPLALGKPAREVWSDTWKEGHPSVLDQVFQTGNGVRIPNALCFVNRNDYLEEAYFDYTVSPIKNSTGSIVGLLNSTFETTPQVLSERRGKVLRELASITGIRSVQEYCSIASSILINASTDIPFALLYLNSPSRDKAILELNTPLPSLKKIASEIIDLNSTNSSMIGGPIKRVIQKNQFEKLTDIISKVGKITGGPWQDQIHEVLIYPLASFGILGVTGALVVGVNPRRALDENYENFFQLLTNTLSAGINNVLTFEEERKRFQALSELDKAKTQFFNNVSHEFRTPLTLILGPTEESLSDTDSPLSSEQRVRLELVRANSLRLRKLVDSLLDLSKIEAGKVEASFESVDLAKLTAEIGSAFDPITKESGLKYTITTEPIGEPVFVDREMWEKIVLNLISNAFKYTPKGEIAVTLLRKGNHAELSVKDSGIGIPTEEISNIFDRFYRVQKTQSHARSSEGIGIGLALIQDLIKIHGGSIQAQSPGLNKGSTFTVRIPLGNAHIPVQWLRSRPFKNLPLSQSQAFTSEAHRWLPSSSHSLGQGKTSTTEAPQDKLLAGRVLVVDDNADMRDYIGNLLGKYWKVGFATNGELAYQIAKQGEYDLILSDVAMPGMDGIRLAQRIRQDLKTQTTAIILMSARANEEARMVGLESGVDDYLVKPFSRKELVTRVKTCLELKTLRDEQLKISEESLKLALASANMGTWNWDLRTGQVIFDEALKRIFHVQSGDFTSTIQEFENLILPLDRECNRKAIQASIHSHSSFNIVFRSVHSNGGFQWIQSMGRAFYDNEGNPNRILGFILDITKRKQDEETLKKSVKMRDEFILIAAHELRTPLTPLSIQLQLIKRILYQLLSKPTPESKSLAKLLDESTQQVNQLSTLVEEILNFSKYQFETINLNLELVNLNDLVLGVIQHLQTEIKSSKCTLKLHLDEKVQGQWDRGQIRQVVINLIRNAIKYGATKPIEVFVKQQGNHAVLAIRDYGIGIKIEDQKRIFLPFERAVSVYNYGGFGMGLYIAKQIVEAHFGHIRVNSELGAGAAFTVELPLNRRK